MALKSQLRPNSAECHLVGEGRRQNVARMQGPRTLASHPPPPGPRTGPASTPGAENPGTPQPQTPAQPFPPLLTVSRLASGSPSLIQFLQASASRVRFFKKQFLQFLFLIENLIQSFRKQTHTLPTVQKDIQQKESLLPLGPQFSHMKPPLFVSGVSGGANLTPRHSPTPHLYFYTIGSPWVLCAFHLTSRIFPRMY